MMKTAITIFGLFLAAASATPFTDCGSSATLTELRVPDCDVLPCVVYRGTNVSVEFDFTAANPTNTLHTKVKGVIGNIGLPWPGTFPPACDTLLVGDCPIQAGEFVTQKSELALAEAFPSVEATAQWKLLDDNNDVVVCFELEVKLL